MKSHSRGPKRGERDGGLIRAGDLPFVEELAQDIERCAIENEIIRPEEHCLYPLDFSAMLSVAASPGVESAPVGNWEPAGEAGHPRGRTGGSG